MTLKYFLFTDSSWIFATETDVYTFSSIEDAEVFVTENNLNITLRGCAI